MCEYEIEREREVCVQAEVQGLFEMNFVNFALSTQTFTSLTNSKDEANLFSSKFHSVHTGLNIIVAIVVVVVKPNKENIW